MDILTLIAIGLFCAFTACIMPWINDSRIRKLQQEMRQLRRQLGTAEQPVTNDKKPTSVPIPSPTIVKTEPDIPLTLRTSATASTTLKPAISLEQRVGALLPVWIGGIALALAGFFLVKYSVEHNLLSPPVRVIAGVLLGIALLYSAQWLRSNKPYLANGARITQALSGAGIAVLYLAFFAATSLYELLPAFIGFAGMAAVTATAVVLSLRHGVPIALLGLLGGFFTPALIQSDAPSAPLLFIYLYLVFSGLMHVIKRRHWWVLSLPAIIGSFLWVLAWAFSSHYSATDSIWLGLFLLAISATIVMHSGENDVHKRPASLLNYIGLAGSILLMGLITGKAGFGALEWGLFGLLAAAGIALAYFKDSHYGFVPWVAMALTLVMLSLWNQADMLSFALTLSLFAALYAGSGYWLMWRARRPLLWGGLAAATATGFYLLAYYRLQHWEAVQSIPFFWGGIALLLAAAAVYAASELVRNQETTSHQQRLLALTAATACGFVSLALTIELQREFLSVAFAAEMLAISWINQRIPLKILRQVTAVLALAFAFLLLPQIMLLVQLTAYSLVEAKLPLQESVPLVAFPVMQLGIPAAFFLGTAWLLRQEQDSRLVRSLECAAIALIAVMGYYLTRHAFHMDADVLFVKAGFIERGTTTNILFLYGLLCLWLGRNFTRCAFSDCGLLLCAVALFRICYFDVLTLNPLWTEQKISGIFLFNTLLLPFGLPLLWGFLAAKEWQQLGKHQWVRYLHALMLFFAFVLVSLNIRQLFHGEYLHHSHSSNAEIYSYSVAWLLFGIALLFAGAVKKDKMLRYASLALIILTIGKVFLYDASELEGLYRVFSFFGLGLSLLGLSWFYTRFVFTETRACRHEI